MSFLLGFVEWKSSSLSASLIKSISTSLEISNSGNSSVDLAVSVFTTFDPKAFLAADYDPG